MVMVSLFTFLCYSTTTQWRGAVGFFMALHLDMILFKNFTLETVGRTRMPSCDYNDCELSRTAPIVRDFANRNSEFYRQFAKAFTKMITHAHAKLSPPV